MLFRCKKHCFLVEVVDQGKVQFQRPPLYHSHVWRCAYAFDTLRGFWLTLHPNEQSLHHSSAAAFEEKLLREELTLCALCATLVARA